MAYDDYDDGREAEKADCYRPTKRERLFALEHHDCRDPDHPGCDQCEDGEGAES